MKKDEKLKKTSKTQSSKAVKTAPATNAKKATAVVEASVKVSTAKTTKKGISVSVLGSDGKSTGAITLPAEIFDAKVNPVLMAQAVRVYLANQRAGTAATKTRGEVRGSTRKIYRQKGTGRARHGGIRAPIFVGGGIVFGPRPRDFSLKLPTQMKKKALFSALTVKLKDGKIVVTDTFDSLKGKTSEMAGILKKLNLVNKQGKGEKILFVVPQRIENIERATRNIEGVSLQKANNLNTYEVLNSKHILFLKDSIDVLKKTFLKQ